MIVNAGWLASLSVSPKAENSTDMRREVALSRAIAASAGQSHGPSASAATVPASWARMKAATLDGAIPAKVSQSAREIVTAGLANEVDGTNKRR